MERFIVSSYNDKSKLCSSKTCYKMYSCLQEYLDSGKKLRRGLYVWKLRLPDTLQESVDISSYLDTARLVGDLNSWKEYEGLPQPSIQEGHYVNYGRYEPPEYVWDYEDLENAPDYNEMTQELIAQIDSYYKSYINESIEDGELPNREDKYDFTLEENGEYLDVEPSTGITYEAYFIIKIGQPIQMELCLSNEEDMNRVDVCYVKDLNTQETKYVSFVEDVAEYMWEHILDLYGVDKPEQGEQIVSSSEHLEHSSCNRILEMLNKLRNVPKGARVVIEGWYLAADRPTSDKFEHKAFLEYYKKQDVNGKIIYTSGKNTLHESNMMRVVSNMYSTKLNAVQGRKGNLDPDGPTRVDCCMLKAESYTDTQLVTTLKYTATPLVDSNSNIVQSSVLIQKTNEGYYVWYDDNFVINSEESFTSKEDAIQNAMALIEAEFPLHSIEWDEVE